MSADPQFLKRLKAIVGDNISEFARKTGVSQPLVSGYLTARYAPGFDFFFALAKNGVDVNWLLTGKTNVTVKEGFTRAQRIILLLSKLPPEKVRVVERTMETLVEELSGSKRKTGKP